jgi:hypothetical protein
MKFKKINYVVDEDKNYNLSSVEDVYRFRHPQSYFLNYLNNKTSVTRSNFKEAVKKNRNVLYEIGTQQGPYWWLGALNQDFPDLVNMFDLINKVQPNLFKLTRAQKAIIHIDQSLEGFPLYETGNRDFFNVIHQKINEYKINPNQIIYTTSNLIENKVYDKWCKDHKIDKKIKIVSALFFAEMSKSHHFYRTNNNINASITFDDHIEYKTKNSVKNFSCLNRVLRPHRIALIKMLNYYNLIENNDISFDNFEKNYNPNNYKKNHPAFTEENYNNLKSKLPLIIDQKNFEINQAQNFLKDTYLRTWYSVITETYFQDYYKDSVFLSEKIFKPIRAMHPFILVCQPNSLQLMRSLGFKTFSEFWDESYDTMEDPVKRLDKICKLILNLNKLNKDEWMQLYQKLRPILEHNYKNLLNTSWVNYDNISKGLYL